jgi:hypothetical protein
MIGSAAIGVFLFYMTLYPRKDVEQRPHDETVTVIHAAPSTPKQILASSVIPTSVDKYSGVLPTSLIERQLLVQSGLIDIAASTDLKRRLERNLAQVDQSLSLTSVIVSGSVCEIVGSIPGTGPDAEKRTLALVESSALRNAISSASIHAVSEITVNRPDGINYEFIVHGQLG